MTPQSNRLGKMMRLYRTALGTDLRTVAADIGIGHATLGRIEHGQPFDAETLLKVWTWLLAAPAPPPGLPLETTTEEG